MQRKTRNEVMNNKKSFLCKLNFVAHVKFGWINLDIIGHDFSFFAYKNYNKYVNVYNVSILSHLLHNHVICSLQIWYYIDIIGITWKITDMYHCIYHTYWYWRLVTKVYNIDILHLSLKAHICKHLKKCMVLGFLSYYVWFLHIYPISFIRCLRY